MRCLQCNIDLPENYKICPLCKAKTSDVPCLLPGIHTAPYPDYQNSSPKKYRLKSFDNRPRFFLYLTAASSVILGITSLCTTPLLWRYSVPLICAVNALVLIFAAAKEKGEMLHNAVNLFSLLGVQALLTAISLLTKTGVFEQLLAVSYTVFNIILLGFTKKERFIHQTKALFRV